MKIKKFDEIENKKDNVIYQHDIPYLQSHKINSMNSKGYKLYYYKNFDLIEIHISRNSKWKSDYGDVIFYLNDEEYNKSIDIIKKSKDLYDKYIEQSKLMKELPVSKIIYDIVK